MDYRPGYGTQRPLPPQRAVSGSYALQQGLRKPPLPSRLNNVRSVSQPINVVDLTSDGAKVGPRNTAAFLHNNASVYSSPDVIDVDDVDSERPAKRAKIGSGHAVGTGKRAVTNPDGQGAAYRVVPGSPLPQLRKPSANANRNMPQKSRQTVVDRMARRARYTERVDDNGGRPQYALEPPLIATRQPQLKDKEGNVVKDKKGKDVPRKVLDFSPWHGQHPEDILNENVVKTGYYDKAPGVNSTESNSAKPMIWPNLSQKNNMGLQTLSYLFSSVMEKRQQQGKVTAAPSFRPPPRITVPDTKREAWLRDLANNEVPVRKQSRAIPHGIKGKALMEQCLAKNVPIPRAIWLAKCVGANELRQFRRKGVSGTAAASKESQWIREWTVSIEQFLESIISTCGQPDWQSKMDYAMKMATSFYAERILERDHYLDWIVSSFAQAKMERLPIWIILVQLYWKDITTFGRRGRQLAKGILERLHQITMENSRSNDALRDRLKRLVVVMAVTNRGCLILPKTWATYRYLLTPKTLHGQNANLDTPAQNISKRNNRLLLRTPRNTYCALLGLYAILDTVGFDVDVEKLTAICTMTIPNIYKLIPALMSWAGTAYRTATHRVYLTAKIIAHLNNQGHDTDGIIMDFLKSAKASSLSKGDVHAVITELVRTHCFSTGRFLQWLITSGLLFAGTEMSLATGLLPALPIDALPSHLLNTRQMLMRRLGQAVDESTTMNWLLARVDLSTGILHSQPDDFFAGLEALSGSSKLQFAQLVMSRANILAKEGALSVHCFCTLRDILRRCGDLVALSDFTQAAFNTNDTALLATVADTINMHAMTLAALGRLQQVLEGLVEQYRNLRSQQPLDRSFNLALVSLTRRFPEKASFVRLLENDLTICDQRISLAVCSPASDNLVSMQASNLDSDSDIDAVFASGNTMDEQLMHRVFTRIAKCAGAPASSNVQSPSKVCAWLNQLRAVDIGNFEILARNYIRACLKNAGDNTGPISVLCALVASGCTQLDTIADLALEAKTSSAACIATRLIVSKTLTNENLHAAEHYRFQVLQARYVAERADKVVPLAAGATEDPKCPVDDPGLVNLVLDYALSCYDLAVSTSIKVPLSPTYLSNCGRMTQNIFGLTHAVGEQNANMAAKSIIALADPLSIVQCSALLTFYAKVGTFKTEEGSAALQQAILQAIKDGCEVWPQLLESAGQETINGIYQWAKEQVLNSALRFDDSTSMDYDELQKILQILNVAHNAAKDENSGLIISGIAEKLKSLDAELSAQDANAAHDSKQHLQSLDILLHLAVLYSTSANSSNDSLQQNRCNLLASLCSLLVNPQLQSHQDKLEYIHDVASTIADNLPEQALAGLAKSATTGIARDARLASILGGTQSPDAWLALVSYLQPQPQISQQQRVLMKQAQVHGQSGRVPQPPVQQQHTGLLKMPVKVEDRPTRSVPFPLRSWEIIPDAAVSMGENDTSLSLSLFGARKC
ncbi:Mediator of RNA polymerase II transcription subunit 12 [Fulvia fulva]|uniref:Mediator of RNA polymerase II transcription subunit 12 n=1 Tax=Passalora fulva TaxID=5499 RepID=A0A9Q8PMS1_PASFU|nr:Mediator of RNA polymerase II transcription subunit 12 [Fulvia fulva]KAK4609375.1 Mediator of RNA polymerase II transcription subunit 12 [Fulvia fulva]KAK4609483.1 Mediator of RNA polymerase II transcription subunit 12 [Fulvia fulva]UJO25252.1 Mediator of RNA polymerase II transcription subunit 12 [Fulvia fulva]WPV22502.1 Mediator of RNA polymerase II transcription subunit 12 [Fulvia fulva]WPV37900.1 Mediator of RNA polymerase II transcription subunit 12 [Fulvia fulva]